MAASIASWRPLYERAIRIKDLAPWKWMEETDVFGVEDPVSRQVAYVSVTGALGEHLAVMAYLGDTAFHRFLALHAGEGNPDSQQVLELRHIQVSFEDRRDLQEPDLRTIRSLGLRFRGSRAWPRFRSSLPGCFPWFFDEEEIRLMEAILEQTENVATRVKEDHATLGRGGPGRLLLRRQACRDGEAVWEDAWAPFPESPLLPIPDLLTDEAVERLLAHPRSNAVIEVDLVMLLDTPVREGEDRPYFPYALLVADGATGLVLGMDLLQPLPSLEAMWSQVAPSVCECLTRAGFVPKTIKVRTHLMSFLLGRLQAHVPTKVRHVANLPALARVIDRLAQLF